MPFERHIRHTLILIVLVIGITAVVTSLQQERSLAQGFPFQSFSSTSLSLESLSSTSSSSQSSFTTSSSPSTSSSSSSYTFSSESSQTPTSSSVSGGSTQSTSQSSGQSTSSQTTSSESSSTASAGEGSPEAPVPPAVLYRPVCGNGICEPENDDTCETCPRDCGICLSDEEPCGDGNCGGSADCSQDCQSETPDNLPKPPPEILPPIVVPQVIEQAPAQSVDEALNELTKAIANDRLFQKRLEEAGIFPGRGKSLAQQISGIIIELQKEGDAVRALVLNDVLENPSVDHLLQNLPGKDKLLIAANDGNLSAMLDYLPEPAMDLAASLAELERQRHLLMSQYPDLFVDHGSLLLPKAVADETPFPLDAKGGLVESAFLRKRMEALGIDPNTGLASLDQDIKNLTERKKTLAGIIGIMEEDLEKELGNAEGAIEAPTTRSLLNVKGIFLYLSTTANFETLEKTYRSAVADMRTGMAKFQSLFSFRQFSPSAEAAELVGGQLAASLQSPDIGEKKKGTLGLFELQNPLIESMLQELPEKERAMHTDAFDRIRQEAAAAEVSAELEQAIALFSDALATLESDARSERSIFRRPVYFLQDFFGRS